MGLSWPTARRYCCCDWCSCLRRCYGQRRERSMLYYSNHRRETRNRLVTGVPPLAKLCLPRRIRTKALQRYSHSFQALEKSGWYDAWTSPFPPIPLPASLNTGTLDDRITYLLSAILRSFCRFQSPSGKKNRTL